MSDTAVGKAGQAVVYQIDSSHSSAQFKVRHMMIANVKGEFDKVTGTVQFDPADPASARIDASIDAATISTRDEQRDGHLRSAEFLEVEKYPAITFTSKRVAAASSDSFQVFGDLTIHGVKREVILNVEELTPEAKESWGNLRRGASAKTRVNRKDFSLAWNVTLEAGGFLVGDDIDITIDVELLRQA